MKNKNLWLSNICLVLLTVTLFALIDMRLAIFGQSIIVTYLAFALILISGLVVNIFLLVRKTRFKWIAYSLIAFYALTMIPLFTQPCSTREQATILVTRKYLWNTTRHSTPSEIPENLKEIALADIAEFGDKPIVVVNSEGYKDKTWIAYCKSNRRKSLFKTNWVLWHNGKISQKRNMDKEIQIQNDKNLKFYILQYK